MWIRTQDRENLVEVCNVYVLDNMVVALDVYENPIELGTYISYEEAMEVLDHIHNNFQQGIILLMPTQTIK